MLSTCLFQICGIACQSAHYFIFLPSILLLPICCPLWVLSFSGLIESGSHHQSVSEPSSCALNNVINTNSKNTVFLTGEVLVCSFLSLCCSYRKSFTFPSFCGLCRTPQEYSVSPQAIAFLSTAFHCACEVEVSAILSRFMREGNRRNSLFAFACSGANTECFFLAA